MPAEQRMRCSACGAALSGYNSSLLCAPCARIGPSVLIPDSIWRRPDMCDALQAHDFTQVLRLLLAHTPLTRGQIAELIDRDQSGLSRLVTGKQRVKHVEVFLRIVAGLGIPLDLVLPEGLRRGGVGDDGPVDRRTLLTGAAASVTAELLGDAAESGPRVRRIGSAELENVRASIDDLSGLDGRLGGDRLWRLALMQLDWVDNAIHNYTYSDTTGLQLQRFAGELKTSIGWYSFDAGKQGQAHQYFSEALNLAYMTGDHLLVARTLANMARQAIHCGRPREAVLLGQRGAESAGPFVSPRVRALLAIREANGWAALGAGTQCEDAVRRAREAFDRGTDHADPEWVSFLNSAELAGLEGMCRAALQQHRQAAQLLQQSVDECTDGYRRNLGIRLVRLSATAIAQRDFDRAAIAVTDAATVSTQITSTRVRGELAVLRKALRNHEEVPVVRDALEHLANAS